MENDGDPQDHSQSCRVCGKLIGEGVRKVKKGKLSDLLKKVYDVTVAHDENSLPNFVHFTCEKKASVLTGARS